MVTPVSLWLLVKAAPATSLNVSLNTATDSSDKKSNRAASLRPVNADDGTPTFEVASITARMRDWSSNGTIVGSRLTVGGFVGFLDVGVKLFDGAGDGADDGSKVGF